MSPHPFVVTQDLSPVTDYNTAIADDEAKRGRAAAKKRYQKLLKDKSPKLYDQPPHLRKLKK